MQCCRRGVLVFLVYDMPDFAHATSRYLASTCYRTACSLAARLRREKRNRRKVPQYRNGTELHALS
jgi:hypothetical protein